LITGAQGIFEGGVCRDSDVDPKVLIRPMTETSKRQTVEFCSEIDCMHVSGRKTVTLEV
jgi:hypothetical protein